jgi:hypothetical protein
MQKCFISKLYFRETTLLLQGCTIFTVFVTAHLLFAFKELKRDRSFFIRRVGTGGFVCFEIINNFVSTPPTDAGKFPAAPFLLQVFFP